MCFRQGLSGTKQVQVLILIIVIDLSLLVLSAVSKMKYNNICQTYFEGKGFFILYSEQQSKSQTPRL